MKLDIHAHILPKSWPDLKEKYGYGGFVYMDHHTQGRAKMMRDDGTFFREVEQNCWDIEYILADMDKHNVNTMVLCTVPVLFNYWAKPEDALDWSRFLNDHLAEIQVKYPERFIGLGTAPLQHIEFSVQEMTRCVNELHMPGLQIGSNILGKNLDDKSLFPFYKAAEKLGCSLMVHPWDMAGSERMTKYFMQWLVGMPAETTLAICSMIFGGIFDTFPALKVLFAHAGGSFPFTVGRISHGFKARPDLCNVNNIQDPYDYVGKFWVDGITHDEDAFRFLLKTIGSNRIAYGTDYPFPLGDLEHGKFLEEMNDISQEDKDNIFFKSALEFLSMNK